MRKLVNHGPASTGGSGRRWPRTAPGGYSVYSNFDILGQGGTATRSRTGTGRDC